MNKMHKVAIIGASAQQSLGTIKDFVEKDPHDFQLVLGDINVTKLKKRIDDYFPQAKNLKAEFCDASDIGATAKLIEGCDVVIGACLSVLYVPIMKACLKVGAHFVDMGGASPYDEQKAMSDDFKKAGLTGVIAIGTAPGLTNVIAKYGTDKLDTVENIFIRYALESFTQRKKPLGSPYNLPAIMWQMTSEAPAIKDGVWTTVPCNSGHEQIVFPPPIGERTCVTLNHEEPTFFINTYKNKGIRNCNVKASGVPELNEILNTLLKLGLFSKEVVHVEERGLFFREPTQAGVASVTPFDLISTVLYKLVEEDEPDVVHLDYVVIRVIIKGTKNGETLEYTYDMLTGPYKNLPGIVRTTGIPPAVVARMILDGRIKERGVFMPEFLDPGEFFKELAKREMSVSYTVKHLIA